MRPRNKKSRKGNDDMFNDVKAARKRKRELDDDDFDVWKEWDDDLDDITDSYSGSFRY